LRTGVRAEESAFFERMPPNACVLSASSEWSAGAAADGKRPGPEMALPAHLQRYDQLIDLLVEALLREDEEAQTEAATGTSPPAAADSSTHGHEQHADHSRPPAEIPTS
jgi:hypothetical protein